MASGVWRSTHALPCAQLPAPTTISSNEGRYGIIESGNTIKYHWTLVELDACPGYLPTNFWKVLTSFLAEKPLVISMRCQEENCHNYRKPDYI